MSRIILAKFVTTKADGSKATEDHVVIGWDRPLATYYWQEFNNEPRDESGEVDWSAPGNDDWEEMRGFGGYMPNEYPTQRDMIEGMPEKFRHLLTDEVKNALEATVDHHDTGRIIEDLSPTSWKVEVQTLDSGDSWSSNAVRFANFDEAVKGAQDLMRRWMMVKAHRVSPSDDAVNYKWVNNKAVSV